MGVADLKRVVDKYDQNNIIDGSAVFSELFAAFDKLISDESLYARTMRKFSSLLKAGIFFDHASSASSIVSKVKAVRNDRFKAIFFGQFGKNNPATLFDSLCSVLDVYKEDTDYLEDIFEREKKEVQSNVR